MTTWGARSPPMASTPMTGPLPRWPIGRWRGNATRSGLPPGRSPLRPRSSRSGSRHGAGAWAGYSASRATATACEASSGSGASCRGCSNAFSWVRPWFVRLSSRVERARRAPLGSALGRRPGAATRTEISVLTAARAKAGAIFLAEWSHREAQDHGFADLSVEGEDLAVVHVDAPILLVQRPMALDARVLNLSTEDLEVQRENLGKVDQASATLLQRNGMDETPDPDLVAPAVQVEVQGQGPLQGDLGRGDSDRGARNFHLQPRLALGEFP